MDPPDNESFTSRTMIQEGHPPDLSSNGGSDVNVISDDEDDDQELDSWVMVGEMSVGEIDDILMDHNVMEVNAATDPPLAPEQVNEERDPSDQMVNNEGAFIPRRRQREDIDTGDHEAPPRQRRRQREEIIEED